MLEQGPCPYFIGCFGEMDPVCQKNRLIRIAQTPVGIKKTTAGLDGERLNVTVEFGDGLFGYMRQFHGEKTVAENLRRREVVIELDEYFFQGGDEREIAGEQVIGADHDHDHIRIGCLLLDLGQGGKQIGGHASGDPEVYDFVGRHARLPVMVGDE